MVLDKDKAYHVGNSNRYALGIEQEGFIDDPDKWYTWATYTSSARLTRWMAIKHGIPVDRQHIVGHSELPNQSHTDPGPGWNWNLYMPLITEVVPPSEIRGVTVDRSKPCTLTANVDTPLLRTAMPTDLQPAEDRCPVAAGTPLNYWHARRDIDGHHRLFMPAGEGPCVGAGLDTDAYIVAADWTALCPDEAIAAAGITVTIDGGGPITTNPDGSFAYLWRANGTLDRTPHLILLDLMMPGIDGFEVLRRLRSADATVPVIMLTANDAPEAQLEGLDSGADDYVVKPVNFDVLMARVRAIQRRLGGKVSNLLRFDDLSMDVSAFIAHRGKRHLVLTSREFKLLQEFLEQPERVMSKSYLLDRVWGEDFFGDENVVEVFISQLRQKLEESSEQRLIHTIRNVGYVMRSS